MKHISTGDLLRKAIEEKSSIGIQVKATIEKGELVSDYVVAEIVKDDIINSDCDEGFILDGYPRTIEQAIVLNETLSSQSLILNGVIHLDISDKLLMQRITGRLTHPPSGRLYNIYYNPPISQGIDDVTGDILVQRIDDTEEKLLIRLQDYHMKTEPILQYYSDYLHTIDANNSVDQVYNQIKSIIQDIQTKCS